MKFSSMQAYFQRLYNILYITILVPLLGFTYLYLETQKGRQPVWNGPVTVPYTIMIAFVIMIVLSYRYLIKQLKRVRMENSLEEKLVRYATVLTRHFVCMGAASSLLALGYWLWGQILFFVLFIAALVGFSLGWPSSARVCKDLRLMGEERKKVLNKKDLN